MKIIIVEDEIRTRNGLAKVIQNINISYRVVGQYDNGYEGLRNIKLTDVDVVITDVRMPKMSGLDMIKNLRACGNNTEFIVLSGYAEFEYAQQAISLGVSEYLLKPITITLLKQCLERVEQKINQKQEISNENELTSRSNNYSVLINTVIKSIDNNYMQKQSLDEYADRLGITSEYLSTLFTKETGMNFSNYIRDKRIKKARTLLEDRNMKIYEVACRIGYDDPKYFCKVFKDTVGVTPKEYRAKVLLQYNE